MRVTEMKLVTASIETDLAKHYLATYFNQTYTLHVHHDMCPK